MIQQLAGEGSSCILSPLPVAKAVPPYTQNGTSEPILAPISASSSNERPNSQIIFNPFNVAAASLLPPASPAATGISFRL